MKFYSQARKKNRGERNRTFHLRRVDYKSPKNFSSVEVNAFSPKLNDKFCRDIISPMPHLSKAVTLAEGGENMLESLTQFGFDVLAIVVGGLILDYIINKRS